MNAKSTSTFFVNGEEVIVDPIEGSAQLSILDLYVVIFGVFFRRYWSKHESIM